MDKAYEPAKHDLKWQKFWEDGHFFDPDFAKAHHPKPTGKSFVIPMPPPNVTGVLHQGHALGCSLQDTLVRWHRMRGDDTLYIPGTDHASIAVQMQVVNHLASKGIDARALGRTKFLEEAWKWIELYRPRIYAQIKALGTSCDWSRVRFTMEERLNETVTHAFVELYRRGLIYRTQRLVNWSPAGQTGLSDLEVKYEEREGSIWHLRYPIAGEKNAFIVVATTRPETMLGDSGVAVHPDDERYKHLQGKKVLLPLVNREIPIVADSFVDPKFGSGAVKLTPAHDFNDFEAGERNGLARINIFTKEAKIVAGLPGEASALAGLDRFEARKKVVAAFQDKGLLEKIEKHVNRIGVSERWGDVVEPYLSDQWYCRMGGMATLAKEAVEKGEIEIVPKEFYNQFLRWMENIHDWCISRQLWWGQQIPAYHCSTCRHIEVSAKALTVCPKCNSKMFQDEDVLDTWFSSGLWPFSTLGWPEQSPDFKRFFPTSVLETGFDILFFWVARMIMLSLELTGKIPFSKVYMHPMVRDEHGQKMSKTKGNVVDPLDIVQSYGADTLRLTLNALCVQGRDMRLSDERLEAYRNFINKVWNATRFALMFEGDMPAWRERPRAKHLHDKWILTRLDAAARDLSKAWSEYRMQEAAEILYHFVWNDYCDWYLESAKVTRTESQAIVLHVLGEIQKMLHPLIPHVTEELWHEMPGVMARESLTLQRFPEGEAFPDSEALAEHQFLRDFVSALRNLRSENKVPPGKRIKVYVEQGSPTSVKILRENMDVVCALARLDAVVFGKAPEGALTRVVVSGIEAGSGMEALVPVSELVDLNEEKARLQKELDSLQKILSSQEAKLGNENFVKRAPPEVIEKERFKLTEAQDKLEKTRKALESLK